MTQGFLSSVIGAFFFLTFALFLRSKSCQRRLDEMKPVERAGYLLAIPSLAATMGFLGARGFLGLAEERALERKQSAEARELNRQKEVEAGLEQARQDRQHYSLEVFGLGVTVEEWRQLGAFRQFQGGSLEGLAEEKRKAPPSRQMRMQIADRRAADALEYAERPVDPIQGIPALVVGPARQGELGDEFLQDNFRDAVHHSGIFNLVTRYLEGIHEDHPEGVVERLFRLFDEHPELPAAVLFVQDGLVTRNYLRPRIEERLLLNEPPRRGEMTESMVCLLVGRSDRVQALRAYRSHGDLQDELDKPEWKRNLGGIREFKPTDLLPMAWDQKEIDQFEKLPVLGRIHRPQWVDFRPGGKALGPKGQAAVFLEGWKRALGSLPEGMAPARVIFDPGPPAQVGRALPLYQALHAAGPALDPSGDAMLNLSRRLGETGASSFFLGLGLGLMANHQEGDATAVVSFRKSGGATVVMVSPPTEVERAKPHPNGKSGLQFKLAPQFSDYSRP
jgi:hypothetical protein